MGSERRGKGIGSINKVGVCNSSKNMQIGVSDTNISNWYSQKTFASISELSTLLGTYSSSKSATFAPCSGIISLHSEDQHFPAASPQSVNF